MATERDRDQNGKFTVTEAELELRQAEVIKLRVNGLGFREIAAKLGISVGSAHEAFRVVMERTRKEADSTADEERRVSLERIDRAIAVLMPMVELGDLDAMARLDTFEKRRAGLLGLDAPARQELSGPEGAPIAIDARSSLIERIASLAGSSTAGGAAGEDSRKPDPG